jgi:hypothetical protein
MSNEKKHNLNIHLYSFEEILALFELSYTINIDDLKRAKKRVLMLHPDKSKLSPEYFLFYKKAFDIVVKYYENNNKQNRPLTEETTKYSPLSNTLNKSSHNNVTSTIRNMSSQEFQNKFNQLFEDNMSKKPDTNRNEWFSKEEPIYDIQSQVSANNMNQVFDTIKKNNAELVRYQGVQELYVNNDSGSRLYEDEEDEDTNGNYKSSNPFSKLKFEDLRKVHKDQTIFAVSERDYDKVPQFSSVDHYMRERGSQSLTPIEKDEAERILSMRDTQYRERMIQKEHADYLKSMEYEKKNKSVLSHFLRLGN